MALWSSIFQRERYCQIYLLYLIGSTIPFCIASCTVFFFVAFFTLFHLRSVPIHKDCDCLLSFSLSLSLPFYLDLFKRWHDFELSPYRAIWITRGIERAGNQRHCRFTLGTHTHTRARVSRAWTIYSLVVVIIRQLSYRRKVSGAIRASRNRQRKDAGAGGRQENGDREKEGERALTVVEVGQEVTGFVRIFARAGTQCESRSRHVKEREIVWHLVRDL